MKLWLCRTISHALDPLVTGYLFSESSKCLSMMIADKYRLKQHDLYQKLHTHLLQFVLCSLWNSFAIQNLPEYIFLTPFHCQQIRPSAQFSSKNRLLNVVKLFLKHQNILVFKYLYSTHCLGMSYYVNFFFLGGGIGSNEFHIKRIFGTHGSWKNQNPGGHFGATS